MSSNAVAYDPNDPLQQSFLSALALGETGNAGFGAANTGFGGTDLSGASTDQYGFPTWSGSSTAAGPTHAAGIFQFQPGTWDQVAAQFGLNFQNPEDQEAGAWLYAQQVYSQNTGGQSLETALANGDFTSVQDALAQAFTGVQSVGNGAGIASVLAHGGGANLSPTNSSGGTSTSGTSAGSNSLLVDLFTRGGLIIVGGLVVLVALWQLLSNTGVVPSPRDAIKGAGKLGRAALAAA